MMSAERCPKKWFFCKLLFWLFFLAVFFVLNRTQLNTRLLKRTHFDTFLYIRNVSLIERTKIWFSASIFWMACQKANKLKGHYQTILSPFNFQTCKLVVFSCHINWKVNQTNYATSSKTLKRIFNGMIKWHEKKFPFFGQF